MIPSLTNLLKFARVRARGRKPSLASQRRQAENPSGTSFGAFYYESLLSAVIQFVNAGSRGSAVADAIQSAHPAKRSSFEDVSKGLTVLLDQAGAGAAARGPRRLEVSVEGDVVVSVRVHLELTLKTGNQVWWFIHFSRGALSPIEFSLYETAAAIAARQSAFHGDCSIVLPRLSLITKVDTSEALRPERVSALAAESEAFDEVWRSGE